MTAKQKTVDSYSTAGKISTRRLQKWAAKLESPRASKLTPEIHTKLTVLDDRLIKVLATGDIRLFRVRWMLQQQLNFRILHRQALESLEPTSGISPLLSPEEAVALIRRGDRSVGALTYGWLSPGSPDPAGARMEVVRNALRQLTHIEAIFWE